MFEHPFNPSHVMPDSSTLSTSPFRMGDWSVYPRRLIFVRNDVRRKVTRKVMDAAVFLSQRPGVVVTKEELMEDVWRGAFVSDGAIRRIISQLRDALDDDVQAARYIETIPNVGYRLIADVDQEFAPADQPDSDARTTAADDSADVRANESHHRHWRRALALLTLPVLIVTVLFWPGDTATEPDRRPAMRPLTSLLGDEIEPRLSPDGSHVVYTHVVRSGMSAKVSGSGPASGSADLFVQLVDGEARLKLTDRSGFESSAAWSPDGNWITFVRRGTEDPDDCGIHRIAGIGGADRRLADCTPTRDGGAPSLDWSADGSSIAFARPSSGSGRWSIHSVSTGLSIIQQLTSPPEGAADRTPAFSPGGSDLAFVRTDSSGGSEILIQPVGEPDGIRVLLRQDDPVWGLHWSADGKWLYYLSDAPDQNISLWAIPDHGGVKRRLSLPSTAGLVGDPRVQGDRLLVTAARTDADLWRLTDGGAATVLPQSSSRLDLMPAWGPRGDQLAFLSDRSGTVDLWISGPDRQMPVRLSQARGTDFTQPAWYPDGDRIAWGSSMGVHIVDVSTGTERHLEGRRPLGLLITPGNEIVYTADAGTGPSVRRINENGTDFPITPTGKHELLRRVDHSGAFVTPVGRPNLLLYRPFDAPQSARTVRDDIPADAGTSFNWSFAGDDFYYVVNGPNTMIRHFDPSRGATTDVYRARRGMIRGLSTVPGTPDVVFDILRNNGIDLMLVEPLSNLLE